MDFAILNIDLKKINNAERKNHRRLFKNSELA